MAFTPSMPGIRKSINVMSGRCFFQSSAACCPSPVSATTSMSASCLIMATRPSRTTVWSSATRTRMAFAFPPVERFFCPGLETEDVSLARSFSRMFASVVGLWLGWFIQNDLNFSALTWHRTHDELSPHLVNSFFHTQQSKAFVLRVQIKSRAVVNQMKLDLFRANLQSGSEVFGFRVLNRIGQRLLGDSQ